MSLFKISLFLFLAAAFGAPLPAAPGSSTYEVRSGDSLWSIAARPDVYGDPFQWPLIFEANRMQVLDPDVLESGWNLNLPAEPTADEVGVARELARQYMENGALAPPIEGPDMQDEVLPLDPAPLDAPQAVPAARVFRWLWALSFAVLVFLAFVGYSLAARLFRARAEPLGPALVPQPTESEAILRAQQGPDPLRRGDHNSETDEHRLAA